MVIGQMYVTPGSIHRPIYATNLLRNFQKKQALTISCKALLLRECNMSL